MESAGKYKQQVSPYPSYLLFLHLPPTIAMYIAFQARSAALRSTSRTIAASTSGFVRYSSTRYQSVFCACVLGDVWLKFVLLCE